MVVISSSRRHARTLPRRASRLYDCGPRLAPEPDDPRRHARPAGRLPVCRRQPPRRLYRRLRLTSRLRHSPFVAWEMAPVWLAVSFAGSGAAARRDLPGLRPPSAGTRARSGRPCFLPSGPATARHVLTRGQLRCPLCAPFSPRPLIPRRASRCQAVAASLRGDGGSGPCLEQATVSPDPFAMVRPSTGDTPRLAGPGGFTPVCVSHGNLYHLALCGRPVPCGALAAMLPPGSGRGPTPGPSRAIGGRGGGLPGRFYLALQPAASVLRSSLAPANCSAVAFSRTSSLRRRRDS